MVTCRVCQAMVDISGKREQHVVKCAQCNEATVSRTLLSLISLVINCKLCSQSETRPLERNMFGVLATVF